MPPPAKRTDLLSHCTAFWKCNDNAFSNVVLDAVGAHNGTMVGTHASPPPFTYTSMFHEEPDNPPYMNGYFNLQKFGADAHFSVAAGLLPSNLVEHSFVIWAKAAAGYAERANDILLYCYNDANNYIRLYQSSGSWIWGYESSSGASQASVDVTGGWDCLIFGRNRLYDKAFISVNGGAFDYGDEKVNATSGLNAKTLYIGSDGTGNYFQGFIDCISYYAAYSIGELSGIADEDKWLYNDGDGTEKLRQPVRPKVGGDSRATLIGGALCR